jgi:DNA-binding MarR family transcriptional regulator
MPVSMPLPRRFTPRREKVFGDGRPRPLDRNAKARIMTRARGLTHRTEKGKHYGLLTAKYLAVLEALLWGFHNARTGVCFPSYETIAERAKCARSTVAEAIKALEDAGLLSWVNRIVRVRERCEDLFGRFGARWRIIRTSNGYQFRDPQPATKPESLGFSSKSEIPSGTSIQEFSSLTSTACPPPLDPNNPLDAALLRYKSAMVWRRKKGQAGKAAPTVKGLLQAPCTGSH